MKQETWIALSGSRGQKIWHYICEGGKQAWTLLDNDNICRQIHVRQDEDINDVIKRVNGFCSEHYNDKWILEEEEEEEERR